MAKAKGTTRKHGLAERLAAMPAVGASGWFERLPEAARKELVAVRDAFRSGAINLPLREIWRQCKAEFSLPIGDDAFTSWLRRTDA